jgi:hypothetical protein
VSCAGDVRMCPSQDRKKRIILIRMIPFETDFEQPQARFMFGLNKLCLCWQLGASVFSRDDNV